MQAMQTDKVPLCGLNLVEASAGTGKTYTLGGLYLRLLLETSLAPEQILVLTYTNAATAELKERIRRRLREARQAFNQDHSDEPLLAALLSQCDRQLALRRLDLALAGFDRAAIHTIHGFCQRVLVENAFEASQPFDAQLVPDQGERLQQIADDFWRLQLAALPDALYDFLHKQSGGPEGLLKRVMRGLGKPYLEVRGADWPSGIEASEAELLASYRRLKRIWHAHGAEVLAILSDTQRLKQNIYKAANIPALCADLDAWIEPDEPPLKAHAKLVKFTPPALAKGVKKGQQMPEHPFFSEADSCLGLYQRRQAYFDQAQSALVRQFFDYLRCELPVRQREAGEWSYDDLLLHLQQALEGEAGGVLAESLRQRFPAALVDEFQDTDPVQYRILTRIYAGSELPLFLVGDPKQAIYSFRGADIFAYLEASQAAQRRYSLTLNWRSTPQLIRAFNSLFGSNPQAFFFDRIAYQPVKAAAQNRGELQERGSRSGPLRIWRLPFDDQTPVDQVRQAVVEATAGEIARLLREGDAGSLKIGDRALGGGDIAVLVRTHRQARMISDALLLQGIHSVRLSQESVFHCAEAQQLERLLLALLEPRREALLRAALITDLLGWDAADIETLNHDDRRQSILLETFLAYHQRWRDEGFIGMFRQLLLEQQVELRLLAYADGERRLTNLYQLGELLQLQDRQAGTGMEGLVKWFSRQRQAEAGSAEERLLRLESDSNLVKIVTLHSSKGLQYPLVFCPFAWDEGPSGRQQAYLFHDPRADYRPVFELGSPAFEADRRYLEQEELAENLRLLYVAMTRAQYRLYLPWGKVKRSGDSALAWLLHAPEVVQTADLAAWREGFQALTPEAIDASLERLVRESNGSISLEPLPGSTEMGQLDFDLAPELAPARSLAGPLQGGPRVGSFSSLVSGQAADLPDYDATTTGLEVAAEEVVTHDIHGFPRGPQPGTCLHGIFEHLDFTATSRPELEHLVERQLLAYSLEAHWTSVVADMVESVLATPLNAEGLQLGTIDNSRRVNEMEFHYPIQRLEPQRLAELARQHGFAVSERITSQFKRLQFPPLQGFMKGYIDLVFESGGRFYLLDYKSNWLGRGRAAYGAEALEAAMLVHHYPLQYLFYTLALHRHLRLRLAGYDYERHFGGVFYLFLRGIDPRSAEDAGIFRERPPRAFIEALDRMLNEL